MRCTFCSAPVVAPGCYLPGQGGAVACYHCYSAWQALCATLAHHWQALPPQATATAALRSHLAATSAATAAAQASAAAYPRARLPR